MKKKLLLYVKLVDKAGDVVVWKLLPEFALVVTVVLAVGKAFPPSV